MLHQVTAAATAIALTISVITVVLAGFSSPARSDSGYHEPPVSGGPATSQGSGTR